MMPPLGGGNRRGDRGSANSPDIVRHYPAGKSASKQQLSQPQGLAVARSANDLSRAKLARVCWRRPVVSTRRITCRSSARRRAGRRRIRLDQTAPVRPSIREVVWQGAAPADLARQPLKVEQTRGSGFGYKGPRGPRGGKAGPRCIRRRRTFRPVRWPRNALRSSKD